MVAPNRFVYMLKTETYECDLIWKTLFADLEHSGLRGWALHPMASVFLRDRWGEREKRKPGEDGDRGCSNAATSQGTPGATRVGRDKEGLSPKAFGGSIALQTPQFYLSDHHNCETINL